MTQIDKFEIDLGEFERKFSQIQDCQNEHIGSSGSCSSCKMVTKCPKIKDFVVLQFDTNKQKLKECQNSNKLDSCMNCDLFFECQIRHNFVRSTYEKMNEGRGGEFDF